MRSRKKAKSKPVKRSLVKKKKTRVLARKKAVRTIAIPTHLTAFVAAQDPSLYTFIDHASWRFILRVSQRFFAKKAHEKYLEGLEETGICIERIPLISEMDAKLKRFGWRAVPVVGFIPPAVFLEFLSIGVLPIACDMRTLEHLGYTPAPDIVHEAAGHAPILADRSYAKYLKQYGEVSRKAIIAQHDLNLYDAIRELSDIKENPSSTSADIAKAERELQKALSLIDHTSEAAELSRMAWWTTEYGLVGDLKNPKIYGAGLLSSLSESFHCFDRAVKKLPFDLNCIQQHYDITKPQPQLFVTPNFEALGVVLEQFARTMAFKTGGITGLQKAQRSRAVCTVELDSGVQIGGKLVETLCARDGSPAYLRFEGPCQLAIREKELKGHGVARHPQGFGCPVGPIESERKLSTGKTEITFVSGVKILGVPKPGARGFVKTFTDCKVQWGDRILFEPAWGEYDWVRGNTIKSVFGHAPDRSSYVASMGGYTQRPSKPKTNLTKENAELNVLYAEVRAFRESVLRKKASLANLPEATGVRLDRVVEKLDRKYPRDWLLRLELLEIAGYLDAKTSNAHRVQSWIGNINKRLDEIARGSVEKAEMIARGRELLADASALSKGAA